MTYYEEKITLFRDLEARGGFRSAITRAFANVARFRVEAGTIETIDIWSDFPSPGLKRFTVRKNGADLFPVIGDQLDLADAAHVGKTGQAISVADGDLISFDLNAVEGTVTAPLYFRIGYTPAGGGGSTLGIFSPDPPYAVPSAEDDEFDTGSLDPKWITNLSNAPPTITWPIPNCISLEGVSSGSAQAIMQAVPDVNSIFRMKVAAFEKQAGTGSMLGFAVRSGSNRWDVYVFDVNNRLFRQYQCFNPNSVFLQNNLQDISGTFLQGDLPPMWLEVVYTSSSKNVMFRYSMDGLTFYSVWSAGTILGDPISHVGIHCYGNNTTPNHVDWFRRLQGLYAGGSV